MTVEIIYQIKQHATAKSFPDGDTYCSLSAETSLGCLPQAVTLLSSLECSEVLKILLKKGTVSRNKLIVVDLLDNTFDVLQIA